MQSPLPRVPSMGVSTDPSPSEFDADSLAHSEDSGTDLSFALEQREERMACVLFALVGIGYLFPFSALTQPADYWKMLFPDYSIEFTITSTFMYTNITCLGLIVVLLGTNPWFSGRIVGGFLGQFFVLVLVPTSYFFLTSERENAAAVIGGTFLAAMATAFIDSSTIALVYQYPLRVQESFQVGVGLSTLIGSIYRDITKIVFFRDQLVLSTMLYFYIGALSIALCVGAFFKIMRLRITRKYVFQKRDAGVELTEKSYLLAQKRVSDEIPTATEQPTKWSVLKKVALQLVLVSLVFITTMSLWPPLVTEIKPLNFTVLEPSGWWPLVLLTIFSVSDCAGRFMVQYRCGLTPNNLWITALARLLLIPICILIVKQQLFTHDLWSMLFVVVLGHTNGYLGSLSIIFVNESIHPDEQQLAGPLTSFFLNIGMVLGASAGLVMQHLVLGQ